MRDRIILHCDLNSFFASVECVFRPELSAVPMAVCGSVEARHGIVLAKNEPAKRFGVKTAEAVWQAKQKCPELVTVEPHYDRYIAFSRRVREIYERYTDLIEPFGIDECWLDVTGSTGLFGSGVRIADSIRQDVKRETGVTISAGVSFNKVFAKLGSDMKKPDATTVITRENFREKVWPLAAGEMIGVGPATQKKLRSAGIDTLGDLATAPEKLLKLIVGSAGGVLCSFANGLDTAPVTPEGLWPEAKSFGKSVTLSEDLKTEAQVRCVMLSLAERVAHSMREAGVIAGMVQISVRDSSFCYSEHQQRPVQPTRIVEMLVDTGMELFRRYWRWDRYVRAIGIRACELMSEDACRQYSLFYSSERYEKLERLEKQVDLIRCKYGRNAIVRASLVSLPYERGKDASVVGGMTRYSMQS